ncbi:MAG: CHAT domain-containing protein, partial [Hyphomicrobium sp.]
FFYAGARSLLVSHWAVDSDATVQLVTGAFDAMTREHGMSQARALSKAMAALIDSGGPNAHPSNWAPFVVVGGNSPTLLPATARAQHAATPAALAATRQLKSPRSPTRKPQRKAPSTDTTNWLDGIFQN